MNMIRPDKKPIHAISSRSWLTVRLFAALSFLPIAVPTLFATSFSMTPNAASPVSVKPGYAFHISYTYDVRDHASFDESKGVQVRVELRKPGASSCEFSSVGHSGSGCGAKSYGIDWKIPSPYYGEYGAFDLRVVISSNERGGNVPGDVTYFETAYGAAVTVQDNATYRADLTLTPSSVNLSAPQRANFVLSIANTGVSDDSYDLVLSGAGWTFTGLPYLPSVPKGQTRTWNCGGTPPSSMVEGDVRNAVITLMSRAKNARVDQEEFRVAIRSTVAVENVRARQLDGTKKVEIFYDLMGPSGAKGTVSIGAIIDGSTVPALSVTGTYGADVSVGNNRRAEWDAGADWDGRVTDLARISVTVTGEAAATPTGMVLIPADGFQMGDGCWAPVHNIYVSDFYMDKFEVSKSLWDNVKSWALVNGYADLTNGIGKAANHPVHSVNWFDAVKWCNARSEKYGRTPVYYTDANFTIVYRTGAVTNPCVLWSGSGYRLPTEAEWEKAARGTLVNQFFPWGNTISQSRANYKCYWDTYHMKPIYSYDVTPIQYWNENHSGYHPLYDDQILPFTSPTGSFAPNGYGLYDMCGNVWEFCWDWYDYEYYSLSPVSNPQGPAVRGTSGRVRRGGSWSSEIQNYGYNSYYSGYCSWGSMCDYDSKGYFCFVATRSAALISRTNDMGFRTVLSGGQQ